MNIEQVNEALDWNATMPLHERVHHLGGAARRFVAGWETCPICKGYGWHHTTQALKQAVGEEPYGPLTESCPDCVDGMIPSPELVERSRFPVLDSIGMIASKWLRITHDEAMQRPDIQEAATIIAKAVLLASRREEA